MDGAAVALPDSTRAAEVTADDAVALEVVQVAPTWVERGAAWGRANTGLVVCWAMAVIVMCVAVYMKMPRVMSFLASVVRTNHLQVDGAHQGCLSWAIDMMVATWAAVGFWWRMALWAAPGVAAFPYARRHGFHGPLPPARSPASAPVVLK